MGLFDFLKDAGKKVETKEAQAADEEIQRLRAERITQALHTEVEELGIDAHNLEISYSEGNVTVGGQVASQAEREKLILALGNVRGVAKVEENIEVEAGDRESIFYTVKPGDTLSKIAKEHYGNPMKYIEIFEANKPMLTNPDRIYPGQVLRIPPEES